MLKKTLTLLAVSLLLTACVESESNPPQSTPCTVSACINSTTLNFCANGFYTEIQCAANESCDPKTARCALTTQPSDPSQPSQPSDPSQPSQPSDPSQPSQPTDPSQPSQPSDPSQPSQPSDPSQPSQPEPECTVGLCDAELSQTYKACHSGTYVETACPNGELCLGGGCVKAFEEKTPCDGDQGTGYCSADGNNAVVCDRGKLTIWTCKAPCSVDEGGYVDCPKKAPTTPVDECNPKTYRAECINNGANVRLCVDRKIVTWNCFGNVCEVDDANAITCPKNEGVAGSGGLTSGGTFGDSCNMTEYQEACIDNYFARVCEAGIVKIKPAGTCKISTDNPKKVDYSGTSPCDVQTQIDPFCINDGQAMGVCTYDDGTTETGHFEANQCPDCINSERAKACMFL